MKFDLGILGMAGIIGLGVFMAARGERVIGAKADQFIDSVLGRGA